MKTHKTFRTFILLAIAAFGSVKSITPDPNDCYKCKTIFVSAREAIEENQSALLGKYSLMNEKTYGGVPYYVKDLEGTEYFLFYADKESVHNRGWMIGPELGGSVLNIHTRSHDECPLGILSAYDRDDVLDSSFRVTCHNEEVTVSCCDTLEVKAETADGNVTLRGTIAERQELLLGEYKAAGTLNGHPLYSHESFGITTYLTFRKKGTKSDGWMIGFEAADNSISIATRRMTSCPKGIDSAYDLGTDLDEHFSIECAPGSRMIELVKPTTEKLETVQATTERGQNPDIVDVIKDKENNSGTTVRFSIYLTILASLLLFCSY